MLAKDSYKITAVEAFGSTVSCNLMYLSLCLPVSMFVSVCISMYIVYLSAQPHQRVCEVCDSMTLNRSF